MDFSNPEFWLKVGLIVWNVLLTGVVWLRKPGQDAQQAVARVERRISSEVAKIDHRLVVAEERLKHMPTSDQFNELTGTVRRLEATTEHQNETLAALRASLARVESYLLTSK